MEQDQSSTVNQDDTTAAATQDAPPSAPTPTTPAAVDGPLTGWVDQALAALTPDRTASLTQFDRDTVENIRAARVLEKAGKGPAVRGEYLTHLRRIGESVRDANGQPILKGFGSGSGVRVG